MNLDLDTHGNAVEMQIKKRNRKAAWATLAIALAVLAASLKFAGVF